MTRLVICSVIGCCLLVETGQAFAGVIEIVGDTGDGQIGVEGSIAGLAVETDKTGTGGNDLRGLALIYFFELPTLSSGTTITNAELQIEYTEKEATPDFNIDAFGIDARPTSVFDASDYYDGDAGLSSDVLLQASMLTPSTSLGSLSIANLSLLNFVESLYNIDGTPVSNFSTIRLNPDADLPVGSSPQRGYFLALADNATSSFRPRLSLTVVPEPSTLILFATTATCLVGYGWRRKRKMTA